MIDQGASHIIYPSTERPAERLLSLDALRGLTVAVMILVNNAGDGSVSFAQLRHSAWNGCTLTDVVFPLFLFIVGASIYLSFERRLERGVARASILLQVFRRSLLIFFIGLLMNALPFFQWADLRFYGVLQRIAICYLLASAIYLAGGVATACTASVLLLTVYWWLLVHVRVPGFGMPGVDVPVLDPIANLPAWLDRHLVSPGHLYRHTVYDPEGLLSTVSALATTLVGIVAAWVLKMKRSAAQRASMLVVTGLLCVVGGLLWSHTLPLNKRLWTSSYAVFTAGMSMTLLGAFFWFVDGTPRWRRGLTLLLIFGTNALFAYILSEVLAIALHAVTLSNNRTLQQAIYQLLPIWIGPPAFVSLIYSLLFVGACLVPVTYLYRHKIFVKL